MEILQRERQAGQREKQKAAVELKKTQECTTLLFDVTPCRQLTASDKMKGGNSETGIANTASTHPIKGSPKATFQRLGAS